MAESGHDRKQQRAGDTTAASTGRSALPETISVGQVTSRGARFQILRPHAKGGLGKVSVALDRELHREVALKEIRDHYADDPISRERFLAEAEITGGLEHPGIVPVYGLGIDHDGRPFYAMRFIRGQSLQEAVDQFHGTTGGKRALGDRHLELVKLLRRFMDACNAIDYAHSRGVLHRDIKPSNIMLGKYGATLVVDWGLAKTIDTGPARAIDREPALQPVSGDDSGKTLMGEAVGTPPFMSPEQAAGRLDLLNSKTDVYGLGATLYSLLTGIVPVSGSSNEEIHAGVLRGDIRRPREVDRRISLALEAVCLKAIALRPEDRYDSAHAIAADLERWLADEPVTAFREPLLERVRRWARHHRLAVGVATALLVSTVFALAIGYAMVRHERDIASRQRDKAIIAQAAADQANQQARNNAAATRQVVEQFLIQVGDDQWSQIPQFESVRIEMVELAVNQYRQLLKQQPDDRPLLSDAAMAFRRCANLYRMVGRFELAEPLHAEAIDLMKRSVAGTSNDEQGQLHLIDLLSDAADVTLRQDGPVAAEGPFREAFECARELQQHNPNSSRAKQLAARTQLEYGETLGLLGRFDKALRLQQQAADTFRKFADDEPNDAPDDVYSRLLTVFSLNNLGALARETGQLERADKVLSESISRARANLELNPREVNLRLTLAWALLETGKLRHLQGQPEAAEERLNESIASLSQLAHEQQSVASFGTKLAQALIVRGDLFLEQGQKTTASDDAQQALKILTRLDTQEDRVVFYKPFLAKAHHLQARIKMAQSNTESAMDDVAAAQEALDAARKANPASPQLSEEAQKLKTLKRELSP